MFARGGYELSPSGQVEKGKTFGSATAYKLCQTMANGTSNAKFHHRATIKSDHTTTMRMIVAKASLPDSTRSQLTVSNGKGMPTALTEEGKRVIGNDAGVKESFHSLDSMATRRGKERYDAKKERPDWQVKWADKREQIKAGKCPIDISLEDLKPKVDRNAFAVYMAGGGKRLSSIGDAVNAITTMTANSLTGMACPSKDQNSIKHTVARCATIIVALAILGANGAAWRAIIEAVDETDSAELLKGVEVTEVVGWYWLMPLFHGIALANQLIAVAAVDKGRAVDVEDITEAENKKNDTLVKASNMINAIRNDKAMRTVLIEGLNQSVKSTHRTNGVPKAWLALEQATTPAELEKAIAAYLTEDEPGVRNQMSQFTRECHILKILKLAENDRTEADSDSKLYESGRNYTERKLGKFNEAIGNLLSQGVYKLSNKGKIESVAKFSQWIKTHTNAEYRERRYNLLQTAEGRIGHRYHPTVVRETGGPLSRALVNIGFFVRDFGRYGILSLDTNLARVIRYAVQHLWEGVMGSHASMIMSHTFGMVGGWLIVGVALAVLSQGFEAVFGVAGAMLTSSGPGFGVGFASLTFAYGVLAAAGGVFMLAGMGLARVGL